MGLPTDSVRRRQLQTDDGGLKLRYYIFDWDDNVVHMPTRIWMEDEEGTPVPLSTAEFARRRGEPGLRLIGNDAKAAFREFNDEAGDFAGDLRRAMDREAWQGPAFSEFKQAVVEGRLFAIVTARSHREETLRKGVAGFIDAVLSAEERQDMLRSLREFNSLASTPIDDEEVVNEYLRLCHFVGVSSPDFQMSTGVEHPEEGKRYAIRRFVESTLAIAEEAFSQKGREISSISFGMSDDDKKNVVAVEALMRDELSPAYPHVKFVVFDTGGGRTSRLNSHLALRPSEA